MKTKRLQNKCMIVFPHCASTLYWELQKVVVQIIVYQLPCFWLAAVCFHWVAKLLVNMMSHTVEVNAIHYNTHDQNIWHMISTILPHILSENKAIATDELHYSLWFHYFTSSQSVWVWQAIVMWVLLFGEKNNNNVTLFLLVGNGHRSSEKSFLLIMCSFLFCPCGFP